MLPCVTRRLLIGLSLAAVLQRGGARCATLESLDLASLFSEADAVVLVEEFVSAGPTRPGSCVVKKSYAGTIDLGTQINVIPWRARLNDPAAVIRGHSGLKCIFFLKRQREGNFWGTAFSGVRVIAEDKVLGVAQGSSGLYELVPAASEGLMPLPEGKPYDQAALDEDLAAAADRALRIGKALAPSESSAAAAHLKEILEEELRRIFPGGALRPALTRSDLVLKLGRSLLEKGEVEAIWKLRAKVPAARLRSELEALLLENAKLDFIRDRLDDTAAPERSQMLGVLAESGFRARNGIKPELVRRVFEALPSLQGEDRFTGHAAIAELYRGLPMEPDDEILSKIIAAVGSGDSNALYHFGPLIAEREPVLAVKVLPDQSKLFAIVSIKAATIREIQGRVDFRRLPSGHAFGKPEVVFHRTGAADTVAEIRRQALDAPSFLAEGKSGKSAVAFSAKFEDKPLPGGTWRAFVEASSTGGPGSTWRSGGTTFKLEP